MERCRTCVDRLKHNFSVDKFGLSHNKPELFVKSIFCSTSAPSSTYFCYRASCCLYFVIWFIGVLASFPHNVPVDSFWSHKLYMWTYLSYWGLALLTLDVSLQAGLVMFARYEVVWDIKPDYTSMPTLFKISWCIEAIDNNLAPFISIVFWSLLDSTDETSITSYHMHLVTSIYVVINQIFTARPIRMAHVVYPMWFSLFYLVFSYVYFKLGGLNVKGEPNIYPVLDWNNNRQCMSLVVISAFFIIFMHFTSSVMFETKKKLFEKRAWDT